MQEFDMVAPHDIKLEREILSTVLYCPSVVADFMFQASLDDFYAPGHMEIFLAYRRFFEEGRPFIFETLMEYLEQKKSQGVVDAFLDLYNGIASVMDYNANMKELKAIGRQRKLFRACRIGMLLFSTKEKPSDDDISEWMDGIKTVQAGSQLDTFVSVGQGLMKPHPDSENSLMQLIQEKQEKKRRGEEIFNGYKTGYTDLDKILDGFLAPKFTLIGARPGMGKTTFILNLMINIAEKYGIPIALFSMEMFQSQLLKNLVFMKAGVETSREKSGDLPGTMFQQVLVASKMIAPAPIFIDDKGRVDFNILKHKIRYGIEKHNIKLFFIDYLQLIKGTKGRSKYEEITAISQELKALALEHRVGIVSAAQLNRSSEDKADKRPQMNDLRDSGALEQDADEILLLHSPSYYDPYEKPGILQVIVAKNRSGPTGIAELHFDKTTGKISNLEKIEANPFDSGWTAKAYP